MTDTGESIGDCPSVPSDPESFQALLSLFTLEKAFYEIGYETANRPAWARIPIRGVHRLVMGDEGAGEPAGSLTLGVS